MATALWLAARRVLGDPAQRHDRLVRDPG